MKFCSLSLESNAAVRDVVWSVTVKWEASVSGETECGRAPQPEEGMMERGRQHGAVPG